MADTFSSQQIPFDLSPQRAMSFERFLMSDCNAKIVSHVKDWGNWPSPILLLIGENGTGKTHLGTAFASISTQTHFLDDIENVDEAKLFAAINLALTGEMDALLMSATTHPDGWDIKLPDLRSRLKNTAALELPAPDDDLLEGITRRLFEDCGREVTRDVVTYIVSRTARTVPALQSLVQRLESQAQSDKSDMTKAFVSRHLLNWDESELF